MGSPSESFFKQRPAWQQWAGAELKFSKCRFALLFSAPRFMIPDEAGWAGCATIWEFVAHSFPWFSVSTFYCFDSDRKAYRIEGDRRVSIEDYGESDGWHSHFEFGVQGSSSWLQWAAGDQRPHKLGLGLRYSGRRR